jgi:hypothetical protein
MEELISVEVASRSYDRLVGFGLIILVLIAAAVWVMCLMYAAQTRRVVQKAVKKAEDRVRAECAKKAAKSGGRTFELYMKTKELLTEKTGELDAVTADRDAWKEKYDRLSAEAASCPAYGTRGKL